MFLYEEQNKMGGWEGDEIEGGGPLAAGRCGGVPLTNHLTNTQFRFSWRTIWSSVTDR